jgi:DGQHR domain-containing protein
MRIFTDKNERDIAAGIFSKIGINAYKTPNINTAHIATDIDVLGIYKNLLIIVECAGKKDVGPKIKKFVGDIGCIEQNLNELIAWIKKNNKAFYNANKCTFEDSRYSKELTVYPIFVTLNKSSQEEIAAHSRLTAKDFITLWTKEEQFYFNKVANTEFEYGRYRLFEYLKISPSDIVSETYGSLSFLGIGEIVEKGVYLVNMVVPIETLLKATSIRRLHSYDPDGFQRLLEEKKLESMREYLVAGSGIYPNNLILLLDENATIHDTNTNNIKSILEEKTKNSSESLKKNLKGKCFVVNIPESYHAFYVIDGQHRLFSYAQSKYAKYKVKKKMTAKDIRKLTKDDKAIDSLSKTKCLLITAIKDYRNPEKLFVDINRTQTRIKAEDLIDLYSKLYPDADISMANRLLITLNSTGILKSRIKFKPWEENKIKRASLISYSGLKDIFNKKTKIYAIFNGLFEKQSKINNYVKFCSIIIDAYISAIDDIIKSEKATVYRALSKDMLLKQYYLFSAVFIGALIRLLRHFLSNKDQEYRICDNLNKAIPDKNKICNLFRNGLSIIVKQYAFTKDEFIKQEGWSANKWAKIEADLLYKIRENGKPKFGDIHLIRGKYRKLTFIAK